jgi:hypothetical protein
MKMKSFELERSQLLYEEGQASIKSLNVSVERELKKNEVAVREFYQLKNHSETRVAVLEGKVWQSRCGMGV